MVTMNLGPIGIRVVVVSAPSTSRPAPMSRCRGTVCLGQTSVSQALTVSLVEGDAALRTQRHFAAICEAVLWLIVIDSDQEKVDGYCHAREESSAGTMRGLRYVRNGVAHHIRVSQWTERQETSTQGCSRKNSRRPVSDGETDETWIAAERSHSRGG